MKCALRYLYNKVLKLLFISQTDTLFVDLIELDFVQYGVTHISHLDEKKIVATFNLRLRL